MYPSIEEGLDYAQANSIDRVCIKCDINDSGKKQVDFDCFKERSFIKTLHWLVPLDKRSNIAGMQALLHIEELRWVAGSHIPIDLSPFRKLRNLNIQYSNQITGWEHLTSLKDLMLSAVDGENLFFLTHLEQLEYLRLLHGKLTTIKGLEGCKSLKTLFIQHCPLLSQLKEVVSCMGSLENLLIEKCKMIDATELEQLKLKNLSIL